MKNTFTMNNNKTGNRTCISWSRISKIPLVL